MAGQLAGQRAFITGGASGIGAEMARRFSTEGATVVVADVNDTLGKEVAASVGGYHRAGRGSGGRGGSGGGPGR